MTIESITELLGAQISTFKLRLCRSPHYKLNASKIRAGAKRMVG